MQGVYYGEIQHGHMDQVGYDTYCKLLDEVIKEMQGIEVPEDIDVQIELNVSSYIPDKYINESGQKIKVYQDIALARNEEEIQNVIDTIIDMYGDMPTELENLIEIARIKALCKQNNVLKVAQKINGIVFNFDSNKFRMEIVDKVLEKYKTKVKFSPGKDPYITYKITNLSDVKTLEEVKGFLKAIL